MFVLPTENDAWGLVLNEVMSAGVPVVSTWGAGASHDLIDGRETGFVYESGDLMRLSDILESLAVDEDLRRQMGRAASELIDDWGLEVTVDGYVKSVRGVLRG
jgi:glycosyltransferase involved in cell wall biosynthesis